MEGSLLVCPSCGKQNPENARFCYACGAILAAEAPERLPEEAETGIPQAPVVQVPPGYAQPVPQAVPAATQGYPPAGYPPAYPQQVFAPSKPPRPGRVRCCAGGCLVVLLVLLVGLPILHVSLLRPAIEGEIYRQVDQSLADVGAEEDKYYGSDTETITERNINEETQDAWGDIPGSSDGYIYLQQDQIKLELKIYGVKTWAAADIRVNNRGEFLVKSIHMHWLLHLVFSEGALKREIADLTNEKVLRPRGITVLAFQVYEGKLFIIYEQR